MSCFLTYNLSVTGDCSNTNSGAFDLSIVGSAPNFSVSWLSPFSGSVAIPASAYTSTAYSVTGLSAGTYSFVLGDSCSAQTNLTVNVYISSGTNVSINSINNTVCNTNNGSLTASTYSLYGTGRFYLYNNGNNFISSGESETNIFEFKQLSADTYYVIANDGAGCTGKSETVIIQSSSTLTFELYTINNGGCGVNNGAIYVSGLTGVPPYTYLWSNSQTTTSLTGLTDGEYSLRIIDGSGCELTKTTTVGTISKVTIPSFISTPPTCLNSDGEITVYAVGGTSPYYYLCSNGDSAISFGNNYTFTGLTVGNYTITVTDSSLCTDTKEIPLVSPNTFNLVSVNKVESTCSNDNGEINVELFGTPGTYNYSLSGSNNTQSITKDSLSHTFVGLSSGFYNLTISNTTSSVCTYSSIIEIVNVDKFNFSAQTTGTTCSLNNGIVKLNISTGATLPVLVKITGLGSFQTTQNEIVLNQLSSGSYIVDIIDYDNCKQTKPFTINTSTDVDFALVEDSQMISAIILEGTPPYTLNWSPNVNGQTGSTVSNLSAGTYSLTVIDSSGCAKTRTQQLTGPVNINTYQTYSISNTRFEDNSIIGTKGPKDMLLEGFTDLASNDTNCVLNESIFIAEVTFDGLTTTQPFYTGYTLNEYPSKQQWINVVSNILSGYTGITKIEFNLSTNQFNLETVCEGADYNNVLTTINLIINYDISCEELGVKIHFQNRDDFDFMNDDPFWFQ